MLVGNIGQLETVGFQTDSVLTFNLLFKFRYFLTDNLFFPYKNKFHANSNAAISAAALNK